MLDVRQHSEDETAAYVGFLADGLSLADNLRQTLTSSVAVALLVILPGALALVVWFTMVGLKLPQLRRPE